LGWFRKKISNIDSQTGEVISIVLLFVANGLIIAFVMFLTQ